MASHASPRELNDWVAALCAGQRRTLTETMTHRDLDELIATGRITGTDVGDMHAHPRRVSQLLRARWLWQQAGGNTYVVHPGVADQLATIAQAFRPLPTHALRHFALRTPLLLFPSGMPVIAADGNPTRMYAAHIVGMVNAIAATPTPGMLCSTHVSDRNGLIGFSFSRPGPVHMAGPGGFDDISIGPLADAAYPGLTIGQLIDKLAAQARVLVSDNRPHRKVIDQPGEHLSSMASMCAAAVGYAAALDVDETVRPDRGKRGHGGMRLRDLGARVGPGLPPGVPVWQPTMSGDRLVMEATDRPTAMPVWVVVGRDRGIGKTPGSGVDKGAL